MTLSGSSPLSRLVSRPECFGLLFHTFFQIHQIFCLHPSPLVWSIVQPKIEKIIFVAYMMLEVHISMWLNPWLNMMIDHHHQIHIFMTLMMMMLMRQGCFSKMRSRKVYRNTPLPWFYHRLRHLLFQLNCVIYSWLNICAFNIVLAL